MCLNPLRWAQVRIVSRYVGEVGTSEAMNDERVSIIYAGASERGIVKSVTSNFFF